MRTLSLLLALALPAAADVVFLKNGQRLEGTLQEKGDAYELKTDLETVTIPKADVARIVKSFEAIVAEGEAMHKQARALYDEALKLDPKTGSEKLREGIKILKAMVAMFYDARETYTADKYGGMDKDIVRAIQEIRLYKDKISVEVDAPPNPPPAPPVVEKKDEPPTPPPPAPPKPDASELATRAKNGDVPAQLALAAKFESERNWAEALQWLKTAAEKDGRAQDRLGVYYLEGWGVKQDAKEASSWFEKAASNGCALGWFHLGVMHFTGRGYPKNPQTADEWCEKAFKKLKPEDPETMCAIGWMQIEGMGAAQNATQGVSQYREAAKQGYLPAMTALGDLYVDGRGVEKNRSEAMNWYKQAAEKGWPDAQTDLGEMLDLFDKAYNRRGGTPDYSKAAEWYRKAADQKQARGQFRLADLYRFGRGVTKDVGQALKLMMAAYETASEETLAAVCNGIGWFHLLGEGVAKNPQEAIRYFKIAADMGDALGQSNLGSAYFDGNRNPPEAIRWWVLAAKQGNQYAMNNLGTAYATGRGVAKDIGEAKRWYLMAAQQGSKEAVHNLQILQKQKPKK